MILSEEGGNSAEEDLTREVKLETGKRACVTVGLTDKNEIKKRRKKMKGNYSIQVNVTTEFPAFTGREA